MEFNANLEGPDALQKNNAPGGVRPDFGYDEIDDRQKWTGSVSDGSPDDHRAAPSALLVPDESVVDGGRALAAAGQKSVTLVSEVESANDNSADELLKSVPTVSPSDCAVSSLEFMRGVVNLSVELGRDADDSVADDKESAASVESSAGVSDRVLQAVEGLKALYGSGATSSVDLMQNACGLSVRPRHDVEDSERFRAASGDECVTDYETYVQRSRAGIIPIGSQVDFEGGGDWGRGSRRPLGGFSGKLTASTSLGVGRKLALEFIASQNPLTTRAWMPAGILPPNTCRQ